jgi:hypothetical protein
VTKTLIVSAITALSMIAFGIFWMFMWLVGTNGYSESKGGMILAGNLAMVMLSVIVSAAASGWLAKKLEAKMAWPFWAAAPLAVAGVMLVAVIALVAGSLLIIAVFGRMR